MIYVLDQNYFRTDELRALIRSEPASNFVLPDVALLEMCKSDKWRETMQGSLETLANIPGRVMLSISVGEALNCELAKLKSIEGRLLRKDLTNFVRSILRDVKANDASGQVVSTIAVSINQVQIEIHNDELNHGRNQMSLKMRTNIINSALGTERLKELKKGMVSESSRLSLIYSVAYDLVETYLAGQGHPRNRINAFLRQKPMMLRYYILGVRHAFEWAKNGGLESLPATKVTNDILDQEYVVIASFFDGIKSLETRVNEAYADLRQMLKM
jgi:hypothetical protein